MLQSANGNDRQHVIFHSHEIAWNHWRKIVYRINMMPLFATIFTFAVALSLQNAYWIQNIQRQQRIITHIRTRFDRKKNQPKSSRCYDGYWYCILNSVKTHYKDWYLHHHRHCWSKSVSEKGNRAANDWMKMQNKFCTHSTCFLFVEWVAWGNFWIEKKSNRNKMQCRW